MPTRPASDMLALGVSHRRQWHIVALFVAIVVFQLALGAVSADVLSSVRAYVGGESLWSKAQKDAWFHSTRYSESFAEDDYRKFRTALAVPLGDRRAREALAQAVPDAGVAAAGFLAGNNHPDDVPGMIRLFRWFHRLPFMADAIATWSQADAQLAELTVLVENAHERIAVHDLAAPAVRALATRLPLLNDRLTVLETQFSGRLGDASRKTQQLLLVLNLSLAALMTLAGLRFARRTIREHAQSEQLRLEKVAADRASQAKSEFLARVSHELRTPLNAILGFGQLMQIDSKEGLSAVQAERVRHILHGGQHLLRVVEDILSVTSLESNQTTLDARDVSIAAVVAAGMRQVAFMASAANIRVELAAAPADLVVRGDALRLEQVLVNLLTNAIKYNRAGGWVKVDWIADGATARISVRDCGPGLTPVQLGQLFQPFNRLGAEYTRTDGTGLGLVIVRELTERMGGRVEVESAPGVGSCFTLCLSRVVAAPEMAAPGPMPPS